MKQRTLLLSPCGDCKDHGKNKKRWTYLGKILLLVNSLYGQGSSPQKDAAIAKLTGADGGTSHDSFNSARAEYDDIAAKCGFKSPYK